MKEYKAIKLSKLMEVLAIAQKNAGDTDPTVEFFMGNKEVALNSIGQFGLLPDVVIDLCTIKQYENQKS